MLSQQSIDQLTLLVAEKKNIEKQLESPDVFSDGKKLKKLTTRMAEIRELVEVFEEFQKAQEEFTEAKEMQKDPEMKELAEEEMTVSKKTMENKTQELKKLLVPKDPNDEKDAIIEIRPGAGGEEASLFAGELMRAYFRFAEEAGFRLEIAEKNETEGGGIKEIIFEAVGKGAYSQFKYEAGVHRVQRIPTTESQGRVHTSAVSVVVLPKVEEEDFEMNELDLKFDVYRSSGPGGQSVNTTDSAVRITHLPTNTVVICQDQKSQLKNKIKALSVLRSRLAAVEQEKKAQALGEKRLLQIGSGDRSDKIRTYNFPQDRVTDHRLSSERKNFSNLPGILGGKIGQIVACLAEEEASMRMNEEK